MAEPRQRDAKLTPADLEAAARLRLLWDRNAKRLKLTQEKAGEIMGITQGAVAHYLNKRSPLNLRAVLQFAEILEVEPTQIRTDLAGMPAAVKRTSRPDYLQVPLYSARASAGGGASNDDAERVGDLLFRKASLNRKAIHATSCHAFVVHGDSMYPRLRAGDVILFDDSDIKPRDGKVYVIRYLEHDYVKRLYLEPDARLRISSDNKANPEYADRTVPEDDVRVFGRVRWIGSWED